MDQLNEIVKNILKEVERHPIANDPMLMAQKPHLIEVLKVRYKTHCLSCGG